MVSLILWTWVWVSSKGWCWRGKSDVLQSMGLERVELDWVTELNWTSSPSMTFDFTTLMDHLLCGGWCSRPQGTQGLENSHPTLEVTAYCGDRQAKQCNECCSRKRIQSSGGGGIQTRTERDQLLEGHMGSLPLGKNYLGMLPAWVMKTGSSQVALGF